MLVAEREGNEEGLTVRDGEGDGVTLLLSVAEGDRLKL